MFRERFASDLEQNQYHTRFQPGCDWESHLNLQDRSCFLGMHLKQMQTQNNFKVQKDQTKITHTLATFFSTTNHLFETCPRIKKQSIRPRKETKSGSQTNIGDHCSVDDPEAAAQVTMNQRRFMTKVIARDRLSSCLYQAELFLPQGMWWIM